ncbi:hypothetical protein F3Y22_tig00111873pilonHSYRG00046 [Hibiscus syriacus]|uniref:Major facilitator superfamily protein n=1 Tax=Hibiscus syriacus TaxID=106335 RepID=A0A6A2XY42_HIBSY|nr:hypothetical protein F3Y22_tig00111873pilonHSYRG00046 [Hibiscus syriacus]
MDREAAGLYILDETLESVGFGKFQAFALGYAGLGWFAEAMEIMILSFIGQAVKSECQQTSTQESLLSTIVFDRMLIGAYTWAFYQIIMAGGTLITSISSSLLTN